MNTNRRERSTGPPDEADYLAYLLRIWRAGPRSGQMRAGDAMWRASLEVPQSSRRLGFASLEDLFQFLRNAVANREAESAANHSECDQ